MMYLSLYNRFKLYIPNRLQAAKLHYISRCDEICQWQLYEKTKTLIYLVAILLVLLQNINDIKLKLPRHIFADVDKPLIRFLVH